uniref:Uncharacterized protein n=1 Tax=Sphaeramia orbicularis TaxID=375764 RepID=A0A673CFC5_9TELE
SYFSIFYFCSSFLYNPADRLTSVLLCQAELLDATAGVFIRFRLGGISFPPNIYYKVFTYRPITDMCASSPRDYTKPGRRKPEDQTGWYRRMENNGWRLFSNKMLPKDESTVIGADKKLDFHYSKLQRRQDVDRWRKRRKLEWLRHMYRRGRLQSRLAMDATEKNEEVQEEEQEEQEELEELEELLTWSNTLNFEE